MIIINFTQAFQQLACPTPYKKGTRGKMHLPWLIILSMDLTHPQIACKEKYLYLICPLPCPLLIRLLFSRLVFFWRNLSSVMVIQVRVKVHVLALQISFLSPKIMKKLGKSNCIDFLSFSWENLGRGDFLCIYYVIMQNPLLKRLHRTFPVYICSIIYPSIGLSLKTHSYPHFSVPISHHKIVSLPTGRSTPTSSPRQIPRRRRCFG